MKSPDVRQSFLDFFRDRGHRPWPSAPLVPHGDPTLLFTNAGMVQFKGYFLGEEEPPARRAVSVQKCLRVSGKHNDLENVGPSPRHHTFFEMLGNFSFGDYFKEEAIRFGWELVTRGWGLPPAHLFATVFHQDDEAYELWRRISGLPAERVHRCGMADNFWAMGDTGPCGPCSEIFVDLHPERPEVGWEEGTDSGRYLEIWNLVFMQYDRKPGGELEPLPRPSVDTGAGLERVTAVLQGVESNYDTDLFQPILSAAAELAKVPYGGDEDYDDSFRVIADHLRAVTFLLADGVIPGPSDRGYVLRRILRRAVRHGMRLGFDSPFLHRLVPVLGEVMGAAYPELAATREASVATVRAEEEKFLETKASAARPIQEEIETRRQRGEGILTGKALFYLYDTYGASLEDMKEIAEEEQFDLDEAGFAAEMEARREASRATTARAQEQRSTLKRVLAQEGELSATEFAGYDSLSLEGVEVLRAVPAAGGPALDAGGSAIAAGESGVVVLDRTVLYAEGGGQVGDTGTISWPGGRARVEDTQKDPAGVFFHEVTVEEGTLSQGQRVDLAVDAERRRAVERHHTATHLLHAALRETLGEGVRQAGSLVAPDRLRFDFTFPRPLTDDERRRIEERVNEHALAAAPTGIEWRGYKEAVAAGAMALFGEKYGDRVRTVGVPGVSLELCGGCHVRNTGEIGLFRITGERGVASGVRRIEAVAGEAAYRRVREREELLDEVARAAGAPPERAPAEVAALERRVREAEAELARLRVQMVSGAGAADGGGEVEVDGFRVVAREVPAAPPGELRGMADALRDRLGSGVVVLGARGEGKVTLLAAVTRDLAGRVSAGELVRRLAPLVGGGGGGRADFAQAGGKQPEKLPEA
ncbi:MAG TPA: alanine--tRNA ligase, partial [Thermoanaerobaculia bacterium]|nr:alanine--tRNA ligase [Thermoanaerobaculia bacterium]